MESAFGGFIQNSITKEFVQKANDLIKIGIFDQKDLAKELEWSTSSLSSTMNGGRNIPINKWELFQKVYKDANLKNKRGTMIPFDMGASVKKTEVMVEVILSAIADLVAEKRNFPASVVREQFQAVVNARLNNEEPEQHEDGA